MSEVPFQPWLQNQPRINSRYPCPLDIICVLQDYSRKRQQPWQNQAVWKEWQSEIKSTRCLMREFSHFPSQLNSVKSQPTSQTRCKSRCDTALPDPQHWAPAVWVTHSPQPGGKQWCWSLKKSWPPPPNVSDLSCPLRIHATPSAVHTPGTAVNVALNKGVLFAAKLGPLAPLYILHSMNDLLETTTQHQEALSWRQRTSCHLGGTYSSIFGWKPPYFADMLSLKHFYPCFGRVRMIKSHPLTFVFCAEITLLFSISGWSVTSLSKQSYRENGIHPFAKSFSEDKSHCLCVLGFTHQNAHRQKQTSSWGSSIVHSRRKILPYLLHQLLTNRQVDNWKILSENFLMIWKGFLIPPMLLRLCRNKHSSCTSVHHHNTPFPCMLEREIPFT